MHISNSLVISVMGKRTNGTYDFYVVKYLNAPGRERREFHSSCYLF